MNDREKMDELKNKKEQVPEQSGFVENQRFPLSPVAIPGSRNQQTLHGIFGMGTD